jgi:hypothetical protein
MGKSTQEMTAGVFRDRKDGVSIQARLKYSIKTYNAVGIGSPFWVVNEAKIIQGIDQAGMPQLGGTEIIVGVQDIGVSQDCIEVRMAGVPENPRSSMVCMPQARFEIGAVNTASLGRGCTIPIVPAKRIDENIFILRVDFSQCPYQAVGKIPAASFILSGLSNIIHNFHFYNF